MRTFRSEPSRFARSILAMWPQSVQKRYLRHKSAIVTVHGETVPRVRQNIVDNNSLICKHLPGASLLQGPPARHELTPFWGKQQWPGARLDCCWLALCDRNRLVGTLRWYFDLYLSNISFWQPSPLPGHQWSSAHAQWQSPCCCHSGLLALGTIQGYMSNQTSQK